MGVMATAKIQRSKIKINWTASSPVEAWCMKHVGPRLYWLHSKRGGEGWKIENCPGGYTVELEDPKKMTMLVLTLGDRIEQSN